jgi:hypothetical protein
LVEATHHEAFPNIARSREDLVKLIV